MQTLFTPAHLHLAINHIPIIGLAIACIPVFLGIVFHSRGALASGLISILLCVGTMPFIMQTGEDAQESFVDGSIDPGMDAAGKAAFRDHSHRAKATAPVIYAVGILALLVLLTLIKFPRQASYAGWSVLLGATISIGLGVWTAEAGGRIRHTEFRATENPSLTPTMTPASTPSPIPSPESTATPENIPPPIASPSPNPSPAPPFPSQGTTTTMLRLAV